MLKLSSYHAGDVFYANWDEVLVGATAVVSTLGGVGSEEQMLRINGEANITAVNAAKNFGKNSQLASELKLRSLIIFLIGNAHIYNVVIFLATLHCSLALWLKPFGRMLCIRSTMPLKT